MSDTKNLKVLKDEFNAQHKLYLDGRIKVSQEGIFFLNCIGIMRDVLASIDERLKKIEGAE